MKPLRKFVSPVFALALFLGTFHGTALADKPPSIPAFFDGEIVIFTVVSENVNGVDHRGVTRRAAIPLYAFGPPGNQPQPDVLSAIPGVKGYNPWWQVFFVIPTDGRDLTTNPYTSEAELLAAQAAGDVIIIPTNIFFLCQVLPGRSL